MNKQQINITSKGPVLKLQEFGVVRYKKSGLRIYANTCKVDVEI